MSQEQIEQMFEGRWRMKNYILENIDGKAAKEIARDFFEAGIALSEPQDSSIIANVERTKTNNLEQRAKAFCRTLNTTEFLSKYGMQMLKDFYDYWTEPNPSNTKMRFELQKTWDVNRRLARWARNNFNRYDRQQPTLEQQRKSKLADILTD